MNKATFNKIQKSRLAHLCMAIAFFMTGIIINLIQCILYLSLRPFNKILYRKINWYLCYTIYALPVFLGDWWSDTRIFLYVDREDFYRYYGKEHAYCIMNHTYEVDWLIGWMLCERIHVLGNCKAYAKKVIQYIPVLGWAWKFSEFVFLERSFDKDKDIINKQITELAEHPDPIWLLLFPEGTRFTSKKHEASLEFASKNNLPVLKHHLLPRTRGFIASLPSMKGKIPAIYDIELAFKKDAVTEPTISNMLYGKPLEAHMYMKRIPMTDLPESETEQELFLRNIFVEKDKLRDSFLNTGDFFKTSGIPPIKPFQVRKRVYPLFNMTFWVACTVTPVLWYLTKLLCDGEFLSLTIVASVLGICYLLLNKIIGMSEIKKGSSYGTNTEPKKTR